MFANNMSSKKKAAPTNTSRMNFRPASDKQETKGTKPTAEPSTVKNVLLMLVQHLCRKFLFINTYYRSLFYLGMIFIVSVVMDFAPAPRGAMSKDNFLNIYFVKVGWGWTLLLGLPFVSVTSFVYCCGKREKILRHVFRLAVATFCWYLSTWFFLYVENIYGRCNIKDEKLQSKVTCLRKGFYWQSVDISGHCFILIYSTLVLIEESRVIIGWERIADFLRDEEHSRLSIDETQCCTNNPLHGLTEVDFDLLVNSYKKLTPLVRLLFIAITFLCLIWDIMLVMTVIFYHSMFEKLLAGLIAVGLWYSTYYILYPALFTPPGEGEFRYSDKITNTSTIPPVTKRRATLTKNPTFQ